MSGVGQSNLGVPGLMPQLVVNQDTLKYGYLLCVTVLCKPVFQVNPAALQSQQVLVPVPVRLREHIHLLDV